MSTLHWAEDMPDGKTEVTQKSSGCERIIFWIPRAQSLEFSSGYNLYDLFLLPFLLSLCSYINMRTLNQEKHSEKALFLAPAKLKPRKLTFLKYNTYAYVLNINILSKEKAQT